MAGIGEIKRTIGVKVRLEVPFFLLVLYFVVLLFFYNMLYFRVVFNAWDFVLFMRSYEVTGLHVLYRLPEAVEGGTAFRCHLDRQLFQRA